MTAVPVDATALSPAERDDLSACEQVIHSGRAVFLAVGQALLDIRDRRLYRESHDTFETYCRERWEISASRAYQLIDARAVERSLSTVVEKDQLNEAQARELAPLLPHPETLRQVWDEVVRETDGKPTAAAIRSVRDRLAPGPGPVGEALDHLADEQDQKDWAADFNERTAHLVPEADLVREWSLYVIELGNAVDHILSLPPADEVAANVPEHNRYRLARISEARHYLEEIERNE